MIRAFITIEGDQHGLKVQLRQKSFLGQNCTLITRFIIYL